MRKHLTPSFLIACLFLAAVPAQAADSLYEKSTAKKLDLSQLSFFGPQAFKFKYDQRMLNAAKIAQARARSRSTKRCWGFVKDALLAAKIVSDRPKTAYAKQAGAELQSNYGFKKIPVADPYKAPVGSVLVYGGKGAGHVEFRTAQGFVSDFVSPRPSPRPLIGVFIKPPA